MTKQRTRKSVGVTTMSFNIQEFLLNMEEKLIAQMHVGFTEVKATASIVEAELRKHTQDDTRVQNEIKVTLNNLSGFHKNVKRFTWTMVTAGVGAFIAFCFDMAKNHFHWI